MAHLDDPAGVVEEIMIVPNELTLHPLGFVLDAGKIINYISLKRTTNQSYRFSVTTGCSGEGHRYYTQ